MKRLSRGLVGVDQGSLVLFSDFEDGGVMWTGDGMRKLRKVVRFSEAFTTPPTVQVSLSMWDLDQQTSPRADVSATKVSETEFTILFQTWGDTRVARVRADWLAIGELPDDDAWDVS